MGCGASSRLYAGSFSGSGFRTASEYGRGFYGSGTQERGCPADQPCSLSYQSPARGDIVAFRKEENGHFSVKRIVGLPGETVQITDGTVLIDGEELTNQIYVSNIEYAGEAEQPVELGEDEYFVIGDNHAASDDSRLPGIGAVTRDEIYGEAWFIVSPGKDFGFIG